MVARDEEIAVHQRQLYGENSDLSRMIGGLGHKPKSDGERLLSKLPGDYANLPTDEAYSALLNAGRSPDTAESMMTNTYDILIQEKESLKLAFAAAQNGKQEDQVRSLRRRMTRNGLLLYRIEDIFQYHCRVQHRNLSLPTLVEDTKRKREAKQPSAQSGSSPSNPPGRESLSQNPQIDFAGESDRGIVRKDAPDEDSYFSGAKGQRPKLRLANASSQIAAYNEASRKGQITADHQQKLAMSQDQHKLANEASDKIFTNGVDQLSIVSDGMGGAEAGEYASQSVVVDTLLDLSKTTNWAPLQPAEIKQRIAQAIQAANKKLMNNNKILNRDSGSTITMTMVVNGKLYTANVGDSRTYLLDESGNISRLTSDHSLMESLVKAGQITDDERYTHGRRNEIYRTLGDKSGNNVDVSDPIDVKGRNVKVLSCCDGLWEMVRDPELKRILSQKKPSKEIVKDLIAAANAAGGEDNITAVVSDLNIT
jgi:serine/threonine protein phosphatase PrpC